MKYKSDLKNEKWLHLRDVIFRRDDYICQLSKRKGRVVQAEMVHHIFPRDEFPEYKWEAWNLISLTQAQHNTLHNRTTGALTEEGVALLKRTARKYGIPIPEKYK